MNSTISRETVENVVIEAISTINMARESDDQVEATPDAVLFGEGSPLDSLGLVSLLIEVEEMLRDEGVEISLSDERAMSQKRSPFRSVPALVDYVQQLMREEP